MVRLRGTLPDMHMGLHEVKTGCNRPRRKNVRRTEEVVGICRTHTYVDGEVVAASKAPIQSMIGLYHGTSSAKTSKFFGMVRIWWMAEASGLGKGFVHDDTR